MRCRSDAVYSSMFPQQLARCANSGKGAAAVALLLSEHCDVCSAAVPHSGHTSSQGRTCCRVLIAASRKHANHIDQSLRSSGGGNRTNPQREGTEQELLVPACQSHVAQAEPCAGDRGAGRCRERSRVRPADVPRKGAAAIGRRFIWKRPLAHLPTAGLTAAECLEDMILGG